jgi:2,4-dienoyl-CoA reductase-like NADH-dependent reductase (Old Yellow Enzyme family)
VSAQLAHAGSFSRLKRPLGQRSRGPSVTINDYGLLAGEPIAGAMRPQDFDAVVAQYAATAVRLKTAGFDALEIHMGHGYLLSQFISPATNRRTDAYGGSLVNRMRLPLRVLEAVRAAVGDDMPLIAKLNLDDGLPGGVHVNNSIEACNMLGAGGINAVELSGGFVSRSPMYLFRGESPLPEMIRNEPSAIFRFFFRLAGPKLFPSMPFEPLYFLEQARRVRQAVDVPLIYLGGVSSGDDVRRVLDEEGFDAVALGRTLLHDAGFVERLRADARAASGCTHCNRCVGLLDAPGGISCTLVQG